MKEVTIKSIYGKTLAFRPYNLNGTRDAVEVTYRDDDGNFKGGMIFREEVMAELRSALILPAEKEPDTGTFFLLRQKKSKPSKVKVCFAPEHGAGKEYRTRSAAQSAAATLNERYTEWNYFVAKKETV